jgi:hypothetical protein
MLGVALVAMAAGCEDSQQTQTEAFEKAEAHYRTGEYDAALEGYQAFLDSYPTSPLAKTAELRIRSIHREVRSVLMRKDLPRPQYVGSGDKPEVADIEETP